MNSRWYNSEQQTPLSSLGQCRQQRFHSGSGARCPCSPPGNSRSRFNLQELLRNPRRRPVHGSLPQQVPGRAPHTKPTSSCCGRSPHHSPGPFTTRTDPDCHPSVLAAQARRHGLDILVTDARREGLAALLGRPVHKVLQPGAVTF